MSKTKKQAFTLIELLIVIAIIGILATLAVVALQNARQSARDAKRISDIKQMQIALELYYNTRGEYPDSVTSSIEHDGVVYMAKVPTAPNPADGDCQTASNTYEYIQQDSGASYTIDFCLGGKIGELNPGSKQAVPGGIIIGGGVGGETPWSCGNPIQYEGGPYDSNGASTTTGGYYRTVLIDDQCWFKDNLNIGTRIDGINEQTNNSAIEKYCYNNLEPNCDIYGGLYQWNEAMQYVTTPGAQGICPTGWRIPTDTDELTGDLGELVAYLGGASVAGEKMKTNTWDGNNNSGFTALPAGLWHYVNGDFYNLGAVASFWSSSDDGSGAWGRHLSSDSSEVFRAGDYRVYGFSVRCLRTD